MKLKFIPLTKGNLFIAGSGLFGGIGCYSLASKTNVFDNVVYVFDASLVNPVKSYLIKPITNGIRKARFKAYETVKSVGEIVGSPDVQVKSDDSVGSLIYDGGVTTFNRIQKLIHDFVVFLITQLVPYIEKHGTEKSIELMNDYAKPLKHLLNRPNTERLQSHYTRFQQYINAVKSPKFWESLPIMNGFYLEFREQINTLNDKDLAEVIDLYLENPEKMLEKVTLVMEAIKDDKNAKSEFTRDLMMNFVRSENIDELKAKLAATKVSDVINNYYDIFSSWFSALDDETTKERNKNVKDKISSVFVSFSSWFS